MGAQRLAEHGRRLPNNSLHARCRLEARIPIRGAHAPRVPFPAPRRKHLPKQLTQSVAYHTSTGRGGNTPWLSPRGIGANLVRQNATLSCEARCAGTNIGNTNYTSRA